jgi:hypothetical protein
MLPKLGHGRKPTVTAVRLMPIRSPDTKMICWAAGFYEGEGCCHVGDRGGGYHRMIIEVAQKDPETLHMLRDYFGGRVTLKDQGIYTWYMSGTLARGFAMTIYSLLSTRRRKQLLIGLTCDGMHVRDTGLR